MGNGAPLPSNETQRLAEVARFCTVDSEQDEVFDKIVAMTSAYFNVPITLISIVEEHRQWLRARVGLGGNPDAKRGVFCAYTTLDNLMLDVPDATLDPRFKDNALVTGAPHICYYAGAPLITADGFTLGTLCIIDRVPRAPMSERDAAMLINFAELVMMQASAG